jgi:tRNA(Ile)-lysidine synthase
LLNVSLQSLEAYASEHELNFIEDPSNQDSRFDRNFLRNEILPKLKERWPSIDKTISRSARLQAETNQLLDEVAEQDLLSLQGKSGSVDTLLISKLQSLSVARQKLLVRHWVVVNSFTVPSEKKLDHIFSDIINASDDAQPLVAWRGVELRRYQGKLHIMSPLQGHDNTQVLEWLEPVLPLNIPSLDLTINALPTSQYDENARTTVRFRQGGEKIKIENRGATISLKNLLSEAGIPPWQRSRTPLIYSGETLIKVVGIE